MSTKQDSVVAMAEAARVIASALGITVEEVDVQPLMYGDYVREGVRFVRLALWRCATWPLALIGWLSMWRRSND